MIKSDGEWIGSIDLENHCHGASGGGHGRLRGRAHPKWDERPLVMVVKKPDAEVARDELISLYGDRFARWGAPGNVGFVDAIPLGATGKMQRTSCASSSGNASRRPSPEGPQE